MTPEQQHNIRNGVINIYVITRHLLERDVSDAECAVLLRRVLVECNRIGASAGVVETERMTIQ